MYIDSINSHLHWKLLPVINMIKCFCSVVCTQLCFLINSKNHHKKDRQKDWKLRSKQPLLSVFEIKISGKNVNKEEGHKSLMVAVMKQKKGHSKYLKPFHAYLQQFDISISIGINKRLCDWVQIDVLKKST